MAATIKIIKTTGAVGYEVETEKDPIGLKSIDDATTSIGVAFIEIPAAGTEYSYEAWVRFKMTVEDGTTCDNFKIWGSGAVAATGVVITINTDQVNTYATPVITQSVQGTRDDLANKGSGSKIDVGGSLSGVGDKTDFSVFQLEVINTAAPGDIPAQVVYYSYDES